MRRAFPYPHARSGRKAFTLIEMLVVIGIIALLISLIVPGVRTARERANRLACASNLRQIGQATKMYLNDHGSRFPPVTVGDGGTWATKGFGYIAETFYLPYMNGAYGVFRCPSQRVNLGNELGTRFQFPSNTQEWVSYEFNNGMSCSATNFPKTCTVRHILKPMECAYVWDYTYYLVGGIDYNPHREGLNVLYCDWHVGWLSKADYGVSGQEFYNLGFNPKAP